MMYICSIVSPELVPRLFCRQKIGSARHEFSLFTDHEKHLFCLLTHALIDATFD